MAEKWVAVVGSQDWPAVEYPRVSDFVVALKEKYPDLVLVSGGAKGVDAIAEGAAHRLLTRVRSYRVLDNGLGRFVIGRYDYSGDGSGEYEFAANPHIVFRTFAEAAWHRSRRVVADAEIVVAFWAWGSPGTRHTLDLARELGKEPHVYEPEIEKPPVLVLPRDEDFEEEPSR